MGKRHRFREKTEFIPLHAVDDADPISNKEKNYATC